MKLQSPPRPRPRPSPILLPALLVVLLPGWGAPARAQQPLTLEQAVRAALDHNPRLMAAGEEAQAAAARVDQVRASWLPRIEFSQDFTRGNNPVYVFGSLLTQRQFTAANFALPALNAPAPLDNFRTRFDGAWNLYDFGRTRTRYQGARHLRTAHDFKIEQERQDLILRVVSAYLQVTLAREQHAAAGRAVAASEASEQRVRNMERAGLVVAADLLSAQVHTAQMREREIRAANGVELAQAALQREMNQDVPGGAALAARVTEPPPLALALPDYERIALGERPALRAAELEQRAAQSGARAARAEFLPRVDVFASFERDAETPGGPSGTNWTAGARLHVNLFAGGAHKAQLAEARATEKQALHQLEWLRSGVRLEVRRAFLETRAAQQRAQVMRASSAQAEESLRILQNRYEAGLTNITDLLRAQVAALDSRSAYLAAVQDWHIALAQLEHAAGRLTLESTVLKSMEVR